MNEMEWTELNGWRFSFQIKTSSVHRSFELKEKEKIRLEMESFAFTKWAKTLNCRHEKMADIANLTTFK